MTGRILAITRRLGHDINRSSNILDFGCGSGKTVIGLHKDGYVNSQGFDIVDYLEPNEKVDRSHFHIGLNSKGGLPFKDDTFDFVISEQVFEHVLDQVEMLRELHRIMRSGAVSIHVFPARYNLIEPHIKVPLGGVFGHRWYYKLWALLGIRNEFQKGLTADETARRNAFYFVDGIKYVPNSCYEVIWEELGFNWKWIDQENFDTSHRKFVRAVGKVNRSLPLIGWLNRTFHTRRVMLEKR